MKTLLYITILVFLAGCHPPETTKVIINAIDPVSNQSIDSLKCVVLENGFEIVEKYTKHGSTQMAFDMRSNMSYELQFKNPENSKLLLVQSPGLGISIGKTNEYNLKFLGYGNLDLGLKSLQNMTSYDYLEYQIYHKQYYEVPPISNGWNYGDEDIYGYQDNDHYENHELPAGNYSLQYRVTRSGYTQTGNFDFTIMAGETLSYILNY